MILGWLEQQWDHSRNQLLLSTDYIALRDIETSREKRNYTDPIDRPLRAFYNIPTSGVVPPLNAKVQALGIRAGWWTVLAKMNQLCKFLWKLLSSMDSISVLFFKQRQINPNVRDKMRRSLAEIKLNRKEKQATIRHNLSWKRTWGHQLGSCFFKSANRQHFLSFLRRLSITKA